LMRVFGAERIKGMMGRFGIPEDMPITNRFVSGTLEGAQKKIEGFHFDSRKHTLEYDDVMNHQRKIVYERRQKMLKSQREDIEKLLEDISLGFVEKEKAVKEKREKLGDDAFFETVRRIMLYTNDTLWMEHLEAMDYLRSSVNLRAYGQREPIVEYKREGLEMFKEMEEVFKEQVVSLIETINVEEASKSVKVKEPARNATHSVAGGESNNIIASHKEVGEFSDTDNSKTGRNDLCPCGSGKKYKKCHGK